MIRLETRIVEKPWGRTDIPRAFGDFGGRRIGEIWFEDPAGASAPLLVKFLFTSQRLSIQVHPDDEAARARGHARGKDECWLVVDAEDGGEIGVGLAEAVDTRTLRGAAGDGSIEKRIDWRAASAGDFIYNPAGTIHAIGPGLTLVEVQQNLDLTYRLYDYGRDRELHLDDGLAVATLAPHHDARDTYVKEDETCLLVDGPHFRLLHLAGAETDKFAPQEAGGAMLVPLSNGCSVSGEVVALGECVVLDGSDRIALAADARALLCWPKTPDTKGAPR